jgi:hypothetical protein
MKIIQREHDPLTGVTTEIGFADGKFVQRTSVDDSTAHVEYSKTLQNAPDYSAHGIKESYWHVGHVPPEVVLRWMNEGFNAYTAHPSEIMKRLRQPEYAYLRTTHRKF